MVSNNSLQTIWRFYYLTWPVVESFSGYQGGLILWTHVHNQGSVTQEKGDGGHDSDIRQPAVPPFSSPLPNSLPINCPLLEVNCICSRGLKTRNLNWRADLMGPCATAGILTPGGQDHHCIPSTAWHKGAIRNLIVNDPSTKWLECRLCEGSHFCMFCSLLYP